MPKIAPNSPLYSQFRQDFPAQAGEGITSDLNYSDTIVPIVDMTNAAGEGTLPQDLQQAWDFATGNNQILNTTTTMITTPGFWKVGLTTAILDLDGDFQTIFITDGVSSKIIWYAEGAALSGVQTGVYSDTFIVFLRSGDELQGRSDGTNKQLNVWYRQIADVTGNLVNPLDFSFT